MLHVTSKILMCIINIIMTFSLLFSSKFVVALKASYYRKMISNRLLMSSSSLTPILISIEGNIGAGKTTLLESLKNNNPDWVFINEPVDTWSKIKNDNDESILQVFYKDRKRWSYTFQNCALLTRYQEIENSISKMKNNNSNNGKKIFLTERCLETDYHVFTKMLKSEGSIDKLELELYERLLFQLKTTATPLSAIVHVNTMPTTCKERIITRSRTGEEAISLDYLQLLDSYQCKWIKSTDLPCISIDVKQVNKVQDFIYNLMK